MRDPARIDQILKEIRRVWVQYPDLRLTQLLVNLIHPRDPCPQVFYFEDTELLKRLQTYLTATPTAVIQATPGADDGP